MNRLSKQRERHKVMTRILDDDRSYEECWPSFFYGPEGQAQVFSNPLEVPEGWHDSPDKVGDPDAVTVIPFYDEAVAAANGLEAEEGDDDENQSEEQGEEARDELISEGDDGQGEGDEEGQGEKLQVEELPALDDITKDEIAARLRAKGVNFNPTWNRERLYGVLKDATEE